MRPACEHFVRYEARKELRGDHLDKLERSSSGGNIALFGQQLTGNKERKNAISRMLSAMGAGCKDLLTVISIWRYVILLILYNLVVCLSCTHIRFYTSTPIVLPTRFSTLQSPSIHRDSIVLGRNSKIKGREKIAPYTGERSVCRNCPLKSDKPKEEKPKGEASKADASKGSNTDGSAAAKTSSNSVFTAIVNSSVLAGDSLKDPFYIDSGASAHLVPSRSGL